jgi:phage tail sheath gpL-like
MALKYVLTFEGVQELPLADTDAQPSLARLKNQLKRLQEGAVTTAVTVKARNTAVAATGTVTCSSTAGTLTTTINGVAINATAGGDDPASATAIAAAINASTNALVKNVVTASAASAVVTITSVMPGVLGNCITLASSGTGVTASGARLTGGTETYFSLSF